MQIANHLNKLTKILIQLLGINQISLVNSGIAIYYKNSDVSKALTCSPNFYNANKNRDNKRNLEFITAMGRNIILQKNYVITMPVYNILIP